MIHNQLSRGPFGRALKDALGDSKSEGGLERFGETMQPIIDLWSRPEFELLRGELLWSISLVKAADAANSGVVGIMLPQASKLICTIERISGRNSTAAAAALILSGLDRTTIAALGGFVLQSPPFFRDARASAVPFAQQAPVEAFTALTGLITLNGTMENIIMPAAVENKEFLTTPYVLRAGSAIFVQGGAINQQIVVSFAGRVRTALPTELRNLPQ